MARFKKEQDLPPVKVDFDLERLEAATQRLLDAADVLHEQFQNVETATIKATKMMKALNLALDRSAAEARKSKGLMR